MANFAVHLLNGSTKLFISPLILFFSGLYWIHGLCLQNYFQGEEKVIFDTL